MIYLNQYYLILFLNIKLLTDILLEQHLEQLYHDENYRRIYL